MTDLQTECKGDTCSRWVKTCVDIYTHALFDGDKYSRRDAWGWIIANAAWKPHKARHRGKIIPLGRGQLFVGRAFLARAWGWSESQVRVFLEQLEAEKMIVISSTDGRFANVATVTNYGLYQDNPKTDATPVAPPVEKPADPGLSADQQPEEPPVDRQFVASSSPVDRHTVGKDTKDRKIEDVVVARAMKSIVDAAKPILKDGGLAAGLCGTAGEITKWLKADCDLDADILPVIRSVVAKGTIVTSWKFFSQAIVNARASRLAALPAPSDDRRMPPSPRIHAPKASPKDTAFMAVLERRKAMEVAA